MSFHEQLQSYKRALLTFRKRKTNSMSARHKLLKNEVVGCSRFLKVAQLYKATASPWDSNLVLLSKFIYSWLLTGTCTTSTDRVMFQFGVNMGKQLKLSKKQENHLKHGRGNSFYERNTLEVLVVFRNLGSNPCLLFVINGPNEWLHLNYAINSVSPVSKMFLASIVTAPF